MIDVKQDRVINKITFENGNDVTVMKDARKRKYDEFYTPLQDIQNELFHYGEKLRGKNVICPCDWDIFEDGSNVFSITIEFNEESEPDFTSFTWTINKIKKVRYSILDSIYKTREVVITGKDAENLINSRVTCNFLKCIYSIGSQYGIKSITASGYDVDTGRGVRFQDINYNEYDICITNPPFSLYSEFMDVMIKNRDRRFGTDRPFNFIILASFTNRVTPNVGLNLMLKKCYLGYNRQIHVKFVNPNTTSTAKEKSVCVDWITTFDDAQKEIDKVRWKTNVSYELYKDDFYELENMTMKDGTHPIKIEKVSIIPDDYNGWMFCSIGVLDSLSNEEFEWYGTSFKKYYNTTNPSANPFNHKATDEMVSHNGKKLFHGILIRRRTKENGNLI